MNETVTNFAINFIAFIGALMLLLVVGGVITAVVIYQVDKHQTKQGDPAKLPAGRAFPLPV